MYAVFETGGKQYRAIKGQKLRIERTHFQEGEQLNWQGTGFTEAGQTPVSIKAEVLGVFKEPKVIIFKKTRRHTYKRKNGHRQQLLHVKITEIA